MDINQLMTGKRVLLVDPLRFLQSEIVSEAHHIEHDQMISYLYQQIAKMEDKGYYFYSDSPMFSNGLGKVFLTDNLSKDELSIPAISFDGESSSIISLEKILRSGKSQQLLVKKNILYHQGKSLEVLPPEQIIMQMFNLETGDVVQPFLYSTDEEGYQRDYRAIVIEDNVEFLYSRKSALPLIDPKIGNLCEYPPSKERYLTNISQGGKDNILNPAENGPLTEFVMNVKKRIDDYERKFREQNNQDGTFSGFEKINVDVMTDPNGKYYVSEIHITPEMSEVPDFTKYKDKVVDHLLQLCKRCNYEEIVFFGRLVETDKIYKSVKQTDMPCRIIR